MVGDIGLGAPGRKAKTPEEVRNHCRAILTEFGDVNVRIQVWHASEGCTQPIWCKASEGVHLKDDRLHPILRDYPKETAEVVPLFSS